jgi:hypothetical protein
MNIVSLRSVERSEIPTSTNKEIVGKKAKL